MNPILITLFILISLFIALLAAKSATKFRFCVICASVSLTWIGLLALLRFGLFRDPVIIALLMGESVTGLYYLCEKRLAAEFRIFGFPFLLTLTLAAYSATRGLDGIMPAAALLLILWQVSLAVYIWRKDPRWRNVAAKIIACCRDW